MEGTKPESGFYPTYPSSSVDLARHAKYLKCVREPYGLVGNFDTATGSNLMVIFEKCDRTKRTCKSEEQIEAWMKYKYIFTLENQKKFVSYKFGEEAMKLNSYGNYYSLSYDYRSDFVNRVRRTYIQLNDNIFGNLPFMDNEETGFILDKLSQRFLPYQQPFMNAVTYEVSTTRTVH